MAIKKLIDYFDCAYIITLPDRIDRRRGLEREFARIGIDIPTTNVNFFYGSRPTEQGEFYAIGAKGSFYSHRNVLKLALKNEAKNVLVFEDDVAFRKIKTQYVDQILEQLSKIEWDIIYFGYCFPRDDGLEGPLNAWPGDTIGGHFYAVNGPFVSEMIKYMNECEERPRDHPDGGPSGRDGTYNNLRHIKPSTRVYIAVPNLANQRSSRTDIGPLKLYDKIIWMGPAIQFLRGLKYKIRFLTDRFGF
jgi:glycosyl transferase family 25